MNSKEKVRPTRLKGLFVLHEGVPATIFQSQVMEHVLAMGTRNIEIDVLAFEVNKGSWAKSIANKKLFESQYPEIKITLKKGVNIYYPLSTILNIISLFLFLFSTRLKYDFIHARSDYTTFICLLLTPVHKLPVCWDCRGDSLDELRDALSRKSALLRNTLGKLLIIRQRVILFICCCFSKSAIFVSKMLLQSHNEKLESNIFAVIPCPVPESKFHFNPESRLTMRNEYGVAEGQQVFLYSGSLISYQAIEEQKRLYRSLLNSPDNVILFLTPDKLSAVSIFEEFDSSRFIIDSMQYDDMFKAYCMADFAILLREKKSLNWVASPTKFGEYCLCGLPVIMNNTIEQAIELSQTIGSYIDYDSMGRLQKLNNSQRIDIARKSKEFYSRSALNEKYLPLYLNILQEEQ